MADLSMLFSTGGQFTTPVAAVTATSGGPVVISSVPGRLSRISITAAGTGAVLALYDSATTATGTVLFTTAATTQTLGAVTSLELPAAIGIVASQITGSPGVTISFTKDTVYGR